MDILNFHRTSSLHISSDCCPMAFMADLAYWGLPETALHQCCYKRWVELSDQVDWDQIPDEIHEDEFPEGTHVIQRKLWNAFEHPHTSAEARLLAAISVTCIFISTVILTLETLPYFQEHENKIAGEFAPFMIIEAIYMVYFTLEFLIRLISCPSKIKFLKSWMNWIDLLAIVPYYFTVSLSLHGVTEEVLEEGQGVVGEEGEHAGRSPPKLF